MITTQKALVDLIDENQSFIFKHKHSIEACCAFGAPISNSYYWLGDLPEKLRNLFIAEMVGEDSLLDYLEPEHWHLYRSFIKDNAFREIVFNTVYADSKAHFEDRFDDAIEAFLAPYISDYQETLPAHKRHYTISDEWAEWADSDNRQRARDMALA